MAHARRKFEAALKVGELDASQAMDLFPVLYRIEAELRQATPDDRRARRQVEAVSVLSRLESLLTTWLGSHRPSSGVWRAARYTLRIFPQLRVYTTDGRIPIGNNDIVATCQGQEWGTYVN
jgi:transposase